MLKYIVCLLAITSAWSQVTFSTPKQLPASGATGAPTVTTTLSNGILITTSAASYIVSDTLTALGTAAQTITVYTTLTSLTGTPNIGIGLANLPTGTCTSTAFNGLTTLNADPTSAVCKSDFLTVYNTNPGTVNGDTGFTGVNTAAGKSLKWTIVSPAAVGTGCNTVTLSPPASSGTGVDSTAANQKIANGNGVCQGTATNTNTAATAVKNTGTAGAFMVSSATLTYGLYVEQIGTGGSTVCIQTQAQWDAGAGNCGSTIPATTKDVTWSSPTIYAPASGSAVGTVKQYTQGYLVSLTAPGYVLSDALTSLNTAANSYTVYATLKTLTGTVAIGPAAIASTTAGATCTSTQSTTDRPVATAAALLAGAAKTCASDFLSAYSTANFGTATSDTKTKATAMATSGATTVKYLIISPATVASASTCHAVIFSGPAATGSLTVKGDFNGNGACGTASATNPAGYMKTINNYALSVELEASGTAATVCFQTQAQFTASAGDCGTAVTTSGSGSGSGSGSSSATLLSAIMAPFMLVILAFFN